MSFSPAGRECEECGAGLAGRADTGLPALLSSFSRFPSEGGVSLGNKVDEIN